MPPNFLPARFSGRQATRKEGYARAVRSPLIPPRPKKEAKRWLKALRAGDAEARKRLLAASLCAPADPGLPLTCKPALAREPWPAGLGGPLRSALEELALAATALAGRNGSRSSCLGMGKATGSPAMDPDAWAGDPSRQPLHQQ